MIGYIDSSSFPVYTYGEMMVSSPISPGSKYYIWWTPSNISSGTFTMEGSTYNFSDYSGSFEFKGGIIQDSAFDNAWSIQTLNTNAKEIWQYAFNHCSSLSQVSIPVCHYIGYSAFANCSSLTTITLGGSSVCRLMDSGVFTRTGITSSTGVIYVPSTLYESYRTDSVWSYFFNIISSYEYYYIQWEPSDISGTFIDHSSTLRLEDYSGFYDGLGSTIESSAFMGNSDITNIETNAYYVLKSAFYNCINLSRAILPNCIGLMSRTFAGCTKLEYVSVPLLIGNTIDGIFMSCYALSRIELPECDYLWDNTFRYCSALNYVSIPKCGAIYDYCFWGCINLERIDLPVCSKINHGAFSGCTKLSEVILRSSSVVYLERYSISGDTTFQGTLIEARQGGIYVPSSLVNAYKYTSRWSSLSDVIYPINN